MSIDKDKLDYLLTIGMNDDAFDAWCEQASLDDIDYAIELLVAYSAKMSNVMESLEILDGDKVTDLSEAKELLAHF